VTLALAMPLQRPTPDLRFTPIASAAEYEGEPAFSLDGESLAYVADVGGVLQVFVRRLGDAVSHQVTRMRFDAHRPFWAPNGKLVYFISLAGDREALWSVGVAGGVPELIIENVALAAIDPMEQRLALMRVDIATELRAMLWWSSPPGAEPVRESRPPFDRLESVANQLSFNRAGDLLIWASGTGGQMETSQPLNSFYLFDRSGRAPQRVLMNVPRPVNLPAFAWLADNRHLLLALPDDRLGNRHLWMADTRSDWLRQLTATHTNETTPAASLRGPVAFATDEVDFDLVRIAPDGRTREGFVSTARNEFSPAWSPKGDQFAFITDRSGALEIWARSRDGQWERPVVGTDDFPDAATESMGSLAYSPDGRTLAFQRSASGRFEIWLAPVAGGAPVRLIDSEPGDNPYQDSPSWSPDGAWIAFTQANTDRERQGLKKVRVGTKDIIGIAGDVASFSQSRWSPDGRWILCQQHAGLARVPADGGASEVFATEVFLDFVWAPDSRHVFALGDSDTPGHFALIEIDSANGETRVLNGDLGTVPIANQPIRGFSFAQGQGFLTSLASSRSDIWLLDGFEVPSRTFLRRFGR
jgi:Tol biopolymer transport system component